jgi:O-antigen ligase
MKFYALVVLAGLAAVAALAAAVLRPRPFVLALPFLAIVNGLGVPIGPVSARADQLVAAALAAALAVSVVAGTRTLRMDATAWWLGAVLAANLVASALNSPVPAYSLAQCANLASAWVIYPVLINYLDSRAEIERFFTCSLWAAGIASAIGVVAFLLAIAGFSLGGAEVSQDAAEHLTNAYGAYGTMFEPNIFGSFTAAMLVLCIGLLAAPAGAATRSVPPRLLRWVAGLTATALVLSFTRAAWVGAVAGVIVFAALGGRTIGARPQLRRILLPLGAGALLILVVALVAGNAAALLQFKVLNLFNLESQTAALRITTYAMALDQWVSHPFVGWGTFTFAPLMAQGSDFQQFEGWRNLWIGNFLMLALHDTGVIGVALWMALLAGVLRGGIRAARAYGALDGLGDASAAQRTLALTAAVAALIVPYLATSGFSLGHTWLIIGLLGAHTARASAADPGASAT